MVGAVAAGALCRRAFRRGGQALARAPAAAAAHLRAPARSRQAPAAPHRERHPAYHRATGYVSPARVDPSEFPFELQPGAPDQAALIAVHFGEKSFKHPGPVALRVTQGGKDLAKLEPAAPGAEAWPALCEDVPAALPAGTKLPADAQKDLKGCVQWASLWPGVGAVPARAEVRVEMEQASQAPGSTN